MAGPAPMRRPLLRHSITRGYVEREAKALKPTALGEVVTQLMKDQLQKDRGCGFHCTDGEKPRRSGGQAPPTGWTPYPPFMSDFAATLSTGGKKYGWYPGKSTGRGNG